MSIFELLSSSFGASKYIHSLGAVILLGHHVFGLLWLYHGISSSNEKIQLHCLNKIIIYDFYIGGGVATLMFLTGVTNIEIVQMPFHTNFWALWGVTIFIVSLFVWLLALVPIQIRLKKMLTDSAMPAKLKRCFSLWLIGKLVVLALLLVVFTLMTLKPTAWI